MYRQFVVWIASVLLLVVAIDPTAPSLILATGPIPTQSNYVLNSEGDEWIKVDPGLVKPITPTPVVMQVGNGEEREPRLAPPVLESPESMLGIALDRARNAGPEAVLAFVASQADPHFPLLDEAVRESESLMPGVAPEAPAPDAVNHASLNSGPCAYTSIQLAVNAAANGNTVRVASGTFTETVDISGRAITIEGDYDSTCNTLTSAPTQLNGNAAGSVVDVSAGSVVALRNLNLTGGSAFGAGLELLGSSTVTLSNTNIFSNTGLSGGGIYVGAGSVVTFSDDSDIYNNTASGDGGGAMVFGQLFGYDTDSDVYQNSAANGGGIAVPGGTVRLTNSNVVANTATNNGGGFSVTNGGVFYLANGSRTWLDDFLNIMPRFMVNTAANGGAIYAANSPRVDCDGAEFGSSNDGNKATTGSGGAIYLGGSALFADNCIFRNNEAQAGNGGAIAAYTSTLSIDTDYPASVAAPNLSPDRRQSIEPLATLCNPSTVQCSSLYGNRAISSTISNGYGGAIYVNASTLSLADTFLRRNTAARGGAIYQEGTGAVGVISNTVVYSNTTVQPYGAGIRSAGGAFTITNGTIANNTGGAGYSLGTGQSYVYNTIIWGNSTAAFLIFTAATCNIDQSGVAGSATNPQFVSPGSGESYRLLPNSPAIDACNTGLSLDILNVARPTGSRYDMGAYETSVRRVYLPLVLK